jgi:hypothetical protein
MLLRVVLGKDIAVIYHQVWCPAQWYTSIPGTLTPEKMTGRSNVNLNSFGVM